MSEVDSAQAALLLSTQDLNTAQIAETMALKEGSTEKAYQAMANAGLLKSKQSLTAAEMQNTLQTVLGADADISETMTSLGLSAAMEGETSQTVRLTAAKLREAVANGTLTLTQAQEIGMRTGVMFSMQTQDALIPKLIAKLQLLAAATWKQVAANAALLASNPTTWVVLAGVAIAGLAAGIYKYNKSIDEAVDKAKEKVSELENLKAQNEELRIRKEYLERQETYANQNTVDASKKKYNKDFKGQVTSRESIDRYKEQLAGQGPVQASSYLSAEPNPYTVPYAAAGQNTETDELTKLIAQYEYYTEEKQKALDSGDENAAKKIEEYNKKLSEVEQQLIDNRTTLQGFRDDLSLTGESSEELDMVNDKLNLIDQTLLSKGTRLANYLSADSFTESRKALMRLASEGKLSAETLASGFEDLNSYMDENEITIEELISMLNTFDDSIPKLDTSFDSAAFTNVTENLSSLGNVYQTFLDNMSREVPVPVDAKTLEGLSDVFGSVDGYEEFVMAMGSTSTSSEQAKASMDKLTGSYLETALKLGDCTEAQQNYVISQLSALGIANAEELVTAKLAAQQLYFKLNLEESTDSVYQHMAGLIEQGEVSGITCSALYDLVAAETIFSNSDLDVTDKITRLSELAQAFGITADSAHSTQAYIDAARFAGHYGGKEAADDVLKDAENYYQNKIAEQFGTLTGKYNNRSEEQKPETSAAKAAEQEADVLSSLSSELDSYQSRLKAVSEARKTYDQYGKISADQAQEILDADFKLLAAYGDEEAALERLGRMKLNEMQIQLARNAIDTIDRIRSEADATLYLAGANESLAGASRTATEEMLLQAVAAAKGRGRLQGEAAETILKGYQNGVKLLGQVDLSFDASDAGDVRKSALDRLKDWISSLFDWIEIRLDRLERKTSRLADKAERQLENGNYSGASGSYRAAMGTTSESILISRQAAEKYYAKAEEVLSKAVSDEVISRSEADRIRQGVAGGDLDLSETDEYSREIISQYQQFYEKALAAEDKILELWKQYQDYAEALYAIPMEKAEAKIRKFSDAVTVLEKRIANNTNSDLLRSLYGEAIRDERRTLNATEKGRLEARDNLQAAKRKLNDADDNSFIGVSDKDRDEIISSVKEGKEIDYTRYANLSDYATENIIKYNAALKASAEAHQQYRETYYDYVAKMREYAESMANVPFEKAARALERINAQIELLDARYAAGSASEKNAILKEQSRQAKRQKKQYENEYKETKKNADSLWNSKDLKKARKDPLNADKARGEKLDLHGLKKNSPEYEAAVKYNAAIDAQRKALLDARKAAADYTATLQENAKAAFDNVVSEHESGQSVTNAQISRSDAALARRNALGLSRESDTHRNLYNRSLSEKETLKEEQEKELAEAQKAYRKNYKNMSQEDREAAQAQILAIQEGIYQTEADIADLKKEIFELDFIPLEAEMDRLTAKADTLNDAISLKETKGLAASASDYQSLIKNSDRQITNLEAQNELLKEQQKEYSPSSEQYQELQKQINDNDAAIRQARQDQEEWNNALAQLPYSALEKELELLDAIASNHKSRSDLKTAKGEDLSEADYLRQMQDNDDKIARLREEKKQAFDDYRKVLSDPDGVYGGKTAEEWKAAYLGYDDEINRTLADNEQLKDSLRDDVYWRTFNRAHEGAQRLQSILQGLDGLIPDDSLYDSDGRLTDYGIAKAAVLTKEYENAREEVQNYNRDIANLNELYAEGQYNQDEYTEKLNELQTGMLDAASSMKDYSDSIIDMYQSMAQAELDALFELIDARNEALQAKKNYYDYDKTIRSRTKDIQSLQAQIAALEGVDTAEGKAKRASLEAQLSEAQEELDDTVREHQFELSQDALNGLKDTLQDAFDERWDGIHSDLTGIEQLMADANELVSASADQVNGTMEKLLQHYGIAPDTAKTGGSSNADAGTAAVSSASAAKTPAATSSTSAAKAPATTSSTSAAQAPAAASSAVSKSASSAASGTKTAPAVPEGYKLVPYEEELRQIVKDCALSREMMDNLLLSKPLLPELQLPKVNITPAKPSVTNHFENLINIEGSADAATVEDLKKLSSSLMEQSYQYTSKRIYEGYVRAGGKRNV